MKNYFLSAFALVIICGQSPLYSQSDVLLTQNSAKQNFPLELSVVKNSLAPHTDDVQTYMLQVVNNFDKALTIKVVAGNVSCNYDKKVNVDFQQNVYWSESEYADYNSKNNELVTIQAKGTLAFYVRLKRPVNTILNSWNCTEVKATGGDGNILSNSIMLESFIPDPKDFR